MHLKYVCMYLLIQHLYKHVQVNINEHKQLLNVTQETSLVSLVRGGS